MNEGVGSLIYLLFAKRPPKNEPKKRGWPRVQSLCKIRHSEIDCQIRVISTFVPTTRNDDIIIIVDKTRDR